MNSNLHIMKAIITSLCITACSTALFAQPYVDWARTIGSAEIDISQDVKTDPDGNVYVTGFFSEPMDVDPGAGTVTLNPLSSGVRDIFLAKYTPGGNLVWAKTIGGTGSEGAYSLHIDDAFNLYMAGDYTDAACDLDPGAGTTALPYSNGDEMFFAKYDSSGALIWARGIAGPGADVVTSITTDPQGNIYITGSFQGTVDFDPSAATNNETVSGIKTQIFLAKYDNSGNYLWSESAGTSNYDDAGYDVAVDTAGNVLMCGYITLSGDPSIVVSKYSSAGTNIFQKIFTTSPGSESYATSITTDDSARIYITGWFQGTVDLNPDAGSSLHTSGSNNNILLGRYETDGSLYWSRSFGGGLDDRGVCLEAEGERLTVCGYFQNSADFDLNAGTYALNSNGGKDVFIAQYDLTSALVWAGKVGNNANDEVLNMDVNNGAVYITGWHNNADFDPGSGSYTTSVFGAGDIFFAKYSSECTPVSVSVNQSGATLTATSGGTLFQWLDCDNNYAPIAGATSSTYIATVNGNYAVRVANTQGCADTSSCYTVAGLSVSENDAILLSVYPNPVSSQLTLHVNGASLEGLYIVYDISGRVIMSGILPEGNQTQLQTEGLAPGHYTLSLPGLQRTVRFIKQ